MRILGFLLIVIGVVGLVMGVVLTLHATRTVPFAYENTNHVGQIIGGIVLIPIGVYLTSFFREQKSDR
ncbi:MAG TPA: hypothetical protein VFI39_12020 [Gemmatimonadales bacterium]|nr:hypothetical protein [Gemmatimonadales bacterium]